VSTALTDGVRVTVESHYLPDQSAPALGRYAFAYKVRIENEGPSGVQLLSRHWIITDGNGERQEVRGEGVVGEQPRLGPGERFEYTSGCLLRTPHGSMQGSYHMTWDGGSAFEARIAPFSLTQPNALN
jgi:ApaG protein